MVLIWYQNFNTAISVQNDINTNEQRSNVNVTITNDQTSIMSQPLNPINQNINTNIINQRKPCKCGSLSHRRTNHKDCTWNKNVNCWEFNLN